MRKGNLRKGAPSYAAKLHSQVGEDRPPPPPPPTMSLFNIVGATVKLPQPGATSSKYFPILSFPTVPDARLGFQIASPCSGEATSTQSGISSQGAPLVRTRCAALQGRCTPVPWITLATVRFYIGMLRGRHVLNDISEFHRISGHGSYSPAVCWNKEVIQVTKRRFGKKLSCHFLHPFPGRSLPFSLDSEAAAGHLPNDRCASAQLHASREG